MPMPGAGATAYPWRSLPSAAPAPAEGFGDQLRGWGINVWGITVLDHDQERGPSWRRWRWWGTDGWVLSSDLVVRAGVSGCWRTPL